MSDLPLCACGEFYQAHHPECPARRAFEEALSRLEERTKLLRDVRKDLELRAEIAGEDSVVPLGNTLYARLVDATEPPHGP